MTAPRLTRDEYEAAWWLLDRAGRWHPSPPALAAACHSLAERGLCEEGAVGFVRVAHASRGLLEALAVASAPPRGWVVLARPDDLSSARAPASRERAACVWWSREDVERVALDVGGVVVAVALGEVEP